MIWIQLENYREGESKTHLCCNKIEGPFYHVKISKVKGQKGIIKCVFCSSCHTFVSICSGRRHRSHRLDWFMAFSFVLRVNKGERRTTEKTTLVWKEFMQMKLLICVCNLHFFKTIFNKIFWKNCQDVENVVLSQII